MTRNTFEAKGKAPSVGGWQDIASAPVGGVRVLGFGGDEIEVIEHRSEGYWGADWYVAADADVLFSASHWQPLPCPPEVSNEG